MDFVNEQYIALFKICEQACQISRFVQYWSGSDFDPNAKFVGKDVCQSGFSQSGRTVKEGMVKRIAPDARRLSAATPDEVASVAASLT